MVDGAKKRKARPTEQAGGGAQSLLRGKRVSRRSLESARSDRPAKPEHVLRRLRPCTANVAFWVKPVRCTPTRLLCLATRSSLPRQGSKRPNLPMLREKILVSRRYAHVALVQGAPRGRGWSAPAERSLSGSTPPLRASDRRSLPWHLCFPYRRGEAPDPRLSPSQWSCPPLRVTDETIHGP